jgi:hypothetical protein
LCEDCVRKDIFPLEEEFERIELGSRREKLPLIYQGGHKESLTQKGLNETQDNETEKIRFLRFIEKCRWTRQKGLNERHTIRLMNLLFSISIARGVKLKTANSHTSSSLRHK